MKYAVLVQLKTGDGEKWTRLSSILQRMNRKFFYGMYLNLPHLVQYNHDPWSIGSQKQQGGKKKSVPKQLQTWVKMQKSKVVRRMWWKLWNGFSHWKAYACRISYACRTALLSTKYVLLFWLNGYSVNEFPNIAKKSACMYLALLLIPYCWDVINSHVSTTAMECAWSHYLCKFF